MGTVLLPACWRCGVRLTMPMGQYRTSHSRGYSHEACEFAALTEHRRLRMEQAERECDGSERPEQQ